MHALLIIAVDLDENSPVFCAETDDDETDDERDNKDETSPGEWTCKIPVLPTQVRLSRRKLVFTDNPRIYTHTQMIKHYLFFVQVHPEQICSSDAIFSFVGIAYH